MTVDFNFNFWWILMALTNLALVLWVQSTNRGKAAADDLKAMQKSLSGDTKQLEEKVMHRLGQHSERLSRIESKVEDAIDDQDIAAAHSRVDRLGEQVSAMDGKLSELSTHLGDLHKELRADLRELRDYWRRYHGVTP